MQIASGGLYLEKTEKTTKIEPPPRYAPLLPPSPLAYLHSLKAKVQISKMRGREEGGQVIGPQDYAV